MKGISKIGKAYLLVSLAFLLQCAPQKAEQTADPFQQIKSSYLGKLKSIDLRMEALIAGEDYRENLAAARKLFKQVEPVMAYINNSDFQTLNRPNILGVKEEDQTDIKIFPSYGFQVLEEEIYANQPDSAVVKSNAVFVKSRIDFLLRSTNFDHLRNYHFLWMIRREFIRIATTGITGFDSPVLANSLQESSWAYEEILSYLTFFRDRFSDKQLYDQWINELASAIQTLESDFDTFDRYQFLKQHTDRQLALWNETVADWKVTFPFTLALNNDISTLFAPDVFNPVHFADQQAVLRFDEKVNLGRKLFNDPSLSDNGKMSCATCHERQKAFTDGKVLSAGQVRNSPTLTYAGLQQAYFYDNRAGSLEGQIVSVVEKDTEFHSSLEDLEATVSSKESYAVAFDSLYDDGVTNYNIRNAIANYIRSLAPFNSRFDRNIRGEEQSLTSLEVKGFNLFMGKAACATCHFPPVFNGTVPPEFTESEMELIGTPETAENLAVDDDLGRFYLFNTEERKFFFKTPTIRNIALTAPYMHNGVYTTMEQVMDFYNNGGGAGMGFDLPYQTLPFDSLGLEEEEQQAIIAFMRTLTDEITD